MWTLDLNSDPLQQFYSSSIHSSLHKKLNKLLSYFYTHYYIRAIKWCKLETGPPIPNWRDNIKLNCSTFYIFRCTGILTNCRNGKGSTPMQSVAGTLAYNWTWHLLNTSPACYSCTSKSTMPSPFSLLVPHKLPFLIFSLSFPFSR